MHIAADRLLTSVLSLPPSFPRFHHLHRDCIDCVPMIAGKAFGLVALATGVVSAPAKRQAPSGVPDYVLKYGKYTLSRFHTHDLV